VTFPEPGFFGEQSHSHQKRTPKRKLTIFENTKQVIQDYDTVFDNSIPLRKNDLLRITYFRIPGVPGLHFVPWQRVKQNMIWTPKYHGTNFIRRRANVAGCTPGDFLEMKKNIFRFVKGGKIMFS